MVRCEMLARRYGPDSFRDRSFRVSWKGYFLPLFGGGFAYFLLFDIKGRRHGDWLSFLIAYFIIVIAVYLTQLNARSVVSIKDGTVKYIEGGRERWSVNLEDILKVSIRQWRFCIRARWRVGDQIDLPMHFAKSPLLLAMLRYYRPKKASIENC